MEWVRKCDKGHLSATTYAVEGSGVDGRVDLVGTSDGVRGEEGNNLERAEVAGVGEPLENSGDIVRRERNKTLDGGSHRVLAASEELQLRRTLFFGE